MRGKGFGFFVAAAALVLGMALAVQAASPAMAEESSEKDTYDILLIGVDRRDDSWYGNSDVMILVTVSKQKKTVYLTSFLRDLGVDIPGIGLRKLNAACANGGPDLTVETLETFFELDIDNYAMVDFNSMRDIIDSIGGIDLELDKDEVVVANDYIRTMCEENGDPFEEHEIIGSGMLHLDGYQAVGYCRNRFTGSENDFGRTQRQRKVLGAIAARLREAGKIEAALAALRILPSLQSNIGLMDTVSLLGMAGDVIAFDAQEQHIPYDDLYYVDDELLMTDREETVRRLHETLYGE